MIGRPLHAHCLRLVLSQAQSALLGPNLTCLAMQDQYWKRYGRTNRRRGRARGRGRGRGRSSGPGAGAGAGGRGRGRDRAPGGRGRGRGRQPEEEEVFKPFSGSAASLLRSGGSGGDDAAADGDEAGDGVFQRVTLISIIRVSEVLPPAGCNVEGLLLMASVIGGL